ncbi:MAG: WecB/TagA/CpsF family glycosyltransferase [Holophagales bacterium]|nr:WecB/TagA/CpsF family glycosyltransferase [Holophagales bacterium]
MRTESPIPGPLGRRPRPVRAALRRAMGPWGMVVAEGATRLLDIVLSLSFLAILSPVLLVRAALALARERRLFDRSPRAGRYRELFDLLSFAGGARFSSLAALFNVLKGDLSFVGPRALTAGEAERVPIRGVVRFDVRPGLISPWGLRKKTGVAYGDETDVDAEFVWGETVKGDVGLLARAVPGFVLGGGGEGKSAPPEFSIFGVRIVNTTMTEAVDWILARSREEEATPVAFVNPDCLNIAHGNAAYREALAAAARVLPDGIGIHLACRILETPLLANVNGTDLFPLLCEKAAAEGAPLFLLGARPGVAEAAARTMKERFPGLLVAGVRDGYFSAEEEGAVLDEINRSGARVLLVAMGAPRQEVWLHERRDRISVPVRMGVGGLFDFYSGRIRRAPQWMRDVGLEWVYRLMQEPGRMWRRYVVGNPLFLFRVAGEARRRKR